MNLSFTELCLYSWHLIMKYSNIYYGLDMRRGYLDPWIIIMKHRLVMYTSSQARRATQPPAEATPLKFNLPGTKCWNLNTV